MGKIAEPCTIRGDRVADRHSDGRFAHPSVGRSTLTYAVIVGLGIFPKHTIMKNIYL
jgi:hypothetical protein